MRKVNPHLIPLRQWIATVKFNDGSRITTSIYGRNCSEAELQYVREHTGVVAVVVHQECGIR